MFSFNQSFRSIRLVYYHDTQISSISKNFDDWLQYGTLLGHTWIHLVIIINIFSMSSATAEKRLQYH